MSYYWKVKDLKLRKWYTRKENKRKMSITVEVLKVVEEY